MLDVWCGSRPYDDLLPAGARCVGLDVEGNPYGVADVVSNELLPFPDESFDLVLCVQSFHYMADPAGARGGDRRGSSAREEACSCRPCSASSTTAATSRPATPSTSSERCSAAGTTSRVSEDGGRTVTWTVLTGSLLSGLEQRVAARTAGRVLRPAFLASYALVNTAGRALERVEAGGGTAAFPMNLTLTARKPLRA